MATVFLLGFGGGSKKQQVIVAFNEKVHLPHSLEVNLQLYN